MDMRKMTNHDFDQMVLFFDQMAQTSWLSAVHQQMVNDLVQTKNLLRGKNLVQSDHQVQLSGLHVIDVGCATGRFLHKLADQLERGVGIDLSPEMIKEANSLATEHKLADRLKFYEGDAYHLPVERESFDAAISTCVLFLLPEPGKGIAEISRVLKADGCLLMLNPSPKMSPESALAYAKENRIPEEEWEYLLKWSNVSTRRHRYSNQEVEQILTEYGFKEVRITEVLAGLAHITMAYKQS